MCRDLMTNWCFAAMSAISLSTFCKASSLLAPVFSTTATASLSTCIQKYCPCSSLPHISRATMTASISSSAMLLVFHSLGNFS